MSEPEMVTIRLSREQAERLQTHAVWQVERRKCLMADLELPDYLYDEGRAEIDMYTAIAEQLAARFTEMEADQ